LRGSCNDQGGVIYECVNVLVESGGVVWIPHYPLVSLAEIGMDKATREDNPSYSLIGSTLACAMPWVVIGKAIVFFGYAMAVFDVVLGGFLGLCMQFDLRGVCSVAEAG